MENEKKPSAAQPPETEQGLFIKDVGKEYPTRGAPLVVLRNINFALSPGEAFVIMGPSGSGKSTLLHLLGTLDEPTTGRILLDGKDPFSLSPTELAAFRNQQVGFVFQDHHLLPQCSALENVLIPTLRSKEKSLEAEKRARALLERVGLAERCDYRPAELSGGERQRVALARSLVNRPRLVLADEPTGNLDRRTAETAADLLLELHREEGNLLVVVTHSRELAKRIPRKTELIDGTLLNMN